MISFKDVFSAVYIPIERTRCGAYAKDVQTALYQLTVRLASSKENLFDAVDLERYHDFMASNRFMHCEDVVSGLMAGSYCPSCEIR